MYEHFRSQRASPGQRRYLHSVHRSLRPQLPRRPLAAVGGVRIPQHSDWPRARSGQAVAVKAIYPLICFSGLSKASSIKSYSMGRSAGGVSTGFNGGATNFTNLGSRWLTTSRMRAPCRGGCSTRYYPAIDGWAGGDAKPTEASGTSEQQPT